MGQTAAIRAESCLYRNMEPKSNFIQEFVEKPDSTTVEEDWSSSLSLAKASTYGTF